MKEKSEQAVKQFLKDEKFKMKKQLWEWGGALDLCRQKHEEIRKINRMICDIRSLSAETKADRLDKVSLRYSEEIRRITEYIQTIMERKRDMENLIDMLPKEEQEFLYLRYEKGYGYDCIALKIHMSRAQCFRVQDKALDSLIVLEHTMEKAV